MGRGIGFRAAALALLIALPVLGRPPRPRAPVKQKPVKEATTAPAEPASAEPTPAEPPDTQVKAAGTTTKEPSKDKSQAKVTAVEESGKDKGVKTYKFSAVEVEGRLKSPQIVYFLRRVRAEFEAGDLGHRSFMPELSDTRRSPSLR
jgi:hypothetical protein